MDDERPYLPLLGRFRNVGKAAVRIHGEGPTATTSAVG